MTPVTPPAAMVEAAARGLHERYQLVPLVPVTTPFDGLPDADAARYRDAATRTLTAALSLCEVEWAWRGYRSGLHSISANAVHDQRDRLERVRLVYALPAELVDVLPEVIDD